MGLPGGGRSAVSLRFLRHFHQLHIDDLDLTTNHRIFSSICATWAASAPLPSAVTSLCLKLVDATLALYYAIRSELLPTPAKSHYTFNTRDISKVFSSMQALGTSVKDVKGELCCDTHCNLSGNRPTSY
jgi:dynein heavy chain